MKSKEKLHSINNDSIKWKAIIYRDGDNIKVYKLKSDERLLNRMTRHKKRTFTCVNEKAQVIIHSNETDKPNPKKEKPILNFFENVIFSYDGNQSKKQNKKETNIKNTNNDNANDKNETQTNHKFENDFDIFEAINQEDLEYFD